MEREDVLVKFEPQLGSYANDHGLSRDCIGMQFVETGLRALVKRGAEERYSNELIVAMAAALGEICVQESASFFGFGSSTPVEEVKQTAIGVSAKWLKDLQRIPVFYFRDRKRYVTQVTVQLQDMFNLYLAPAAVLPEAGV